MTQYQGNQQMPNPLKNMDDALKHEEQKLRVGSSDKSGSKGSSLLEPNADEPLLVPVEESIPQNKQIIQEPVAEEQKIEIMS